MRIRDMAMDKRSYARKAKTGRLNPPVAQANANPAVLVRPAPCGELPMVIQMTASAVIRFELGGPQDVPTSMGTAPPAMAALHEPVHRTNRFIGRAVPPTGGAAGDVSILCLR
jgi:hypothetical protein